MTWVPCPNCATLLPIEAPAANAPTKCAACGRTYRVTEAAPAPARGREAAEKYAGQFTHQPPSHPEAAGVGDGSIPWAEPAGATARPERARAGRGAEDRRPGREGFRRKRRSIRRRDDDLAGWLLT